METILQKVNNVCMAVYDVDGIQDLLEVSLKNTLELFDAKRGSIFLLNDDGKGLTLKVAQGMRTDEQKRVVKLLGEGIVGQVAQNKEPLLVEDIHRTNALRGMNPAKVIKHPPLFVRL